MVAINLPLNRFVEVVITKLARHVAIDMRPTINQIVMSLNERMKITKGNTINFDYISLYVIDREDFPISLVAPEGRWAFVNVAPLTKGRGKKPQFLEARVKKEMARIACILFGNMGSSYKRNLMSFLSSAEDLDSFDSDNIPIDSLMRCSHYLLTLGVKPYRRVSYRKACEEGWAPAPTNDIQRVIWEETRQLPTKPIKIEFDPAKGK